MICLPRILAVGGVIVVGVVECPSFDNLEVPRSQYFVVLVIVVVGRRFPSVGIEGRCGTWLILKIN